MKKKLMVLSGVVLSFAPVVAFAQISIAGSNTSCTVNQQSSTLFNLICQIGSLLNSVVPVLIALGIVYFVWGVISYVIADDEEAKSAGRDRMIYGIIGLAAIVAVWGLVAILIRTFGISNTGSFTIPTIPIGIPTP
jgi:hypothetical protein